MFVGRVCRSDVTVFLWPLSNCSLRVPNAALERLFGGAVLAGLDLLAFLHLSLGRQKATSGTFSTDGFGWLGLNPAGVSVFRRHVERCLSGLLRSIQARPKLLFHGRPLPGFPWLFNNFAAACQVMSF